MRALSLTLVTLFVVAGCATPKSKTILHNKEVKTPVEKIIVMPVTTFKGKQGNSSKAYDPTALQAWMNIYGEDKVIYGGQPLLSLVNGSPKTYNMFINSIHNKEDITKIQNSKWTKKMLRQIKGKFGNYPIAFTISNGNKKRFENGKPVYLHMALFDTKTMTWKYITKIKSPKGGSNWDANAASMVKAGQDHIKKLEADTGGNRAPASTK